jgi:hypothetical protein
MSEKVRKLSTRQRQSLAALVTSPSICAAADRVNLSERTLRRYLRDPLFLAELSTLESQLLGAASRSLLAELENTLSVLVTIRDDQTAGAGSRLRSCQLLIDSLLSLRSLAVLENRLNSIEEVIYARLEKPEW